MLRTQVFHRLFRVVGLDIVAADDKAVLGRDPQLEVAAVAHHVKGVIAHNGQQADHPQHGRLARQYVAPDLLVVGDFALLDPAHGRIDIDRRLQTS